MWQELLTCGILRALHLLGRLFGLSAATAMRKGIGLGLIWRMEYSWYWRLYGYLVFIFCICFAPYAFYITSTQMEFLVQNRLLFIVGTMRSVLLFVSALVTLYRHTRWQRRLIAGVNKLLSCQRQLLRLLHTTRLQKTARQLHTRDHLTIYALALSIIFSSFYSLFILAGDMMARNRAIYFASVLFSYGCQLCVQLCLALYLIVQLLISHLSHHCNLHLSQLLRDAQHSDNNNALVRRRRLHRAQHDWLALELHRLWQLQCQLRQLSRCLCSLHDIQMLSFLLLVCMDCVSHGFYTYFVTFSKWWLRKYGESEPWNYYATVFIVAIFGQLILVFDQSHRQRHLFSATRHILKVGVLALPADCSKSLQQMLDLYGLHQQLGERLFRPTVCGLFELNNGLLFGIVQTIIIYTIILIQFDKIINR